MLIELGKIPADDILKQFCFLFFSPENRLSTFLAIVSCGEK